MCRTACRVIRKTCHETDVWLGSISRPDIMVAITTLARHITRWSAKDDKRAARLVGYIAATIDYAHVMRINDPPAELWLWLYFDRC